MYTVIRFTVKAECLGAIIDVGIAMNALRPGSYTGLRKSGDGFCCEICGSPDWGEHQREILRFMTELAAPIKSAVQQGASVTVDVAVEPEDRESGGAVLVLRCEQAVLAALAACRTELELSIY